MRKNSFFLVIACLFLILAYQNCGQIGVVSTGEGSFCPNGNCQQNINFNPFNNLTNHRLILFDRNTVNGQVQLNIYNSSNLNLGFINNNGVNYKANLGVYSQVISQNAVPSKILVLRTPQQNNFRILVEYTRQSWTYYQLYNYNVLDDSFTSISQEQRFGVTLPKIEISGDQGAYCDTDSYEDFYIHIENPYDSSVVDKLICISGSDLSKISEIEVAGSENISSFFDYIGDFNQDGNADFIGKFFNSSIFRWSWRLLRGASIQHILRELGTEFNSTQTSNIENVFGSDGKDLFIYGIEGATSMSRSLRALVWNSTNSEVQEVFRDSIPTASFASVYAHGEFIQNGSYEYVYPIRSSDTSAEEKLVFRRLSDGAFSTVHTLEVSSLPSDARVVLDLIRMSDLDGDGLGELVIVSFDRYYVLDPESGQVFYMLHPGTHPNSENAKIKIFGN